MRVSILLVALFVLSVKSFSQTKPGGGTAKVGYVEVLSVNGQRYLRQTLTSGLKAKKDLAPVLDLDYLEPVVQAQF